MSTRWIYLDNNATTRPADAVVEAMAEAAAQRWANPSSVHRFGQMVRQRVELARASVAALIGARPREVVFTSGGTESNNLALRGMLGGDRPRVLLTSRVEHAAVREPAEALERSGVKVIWLAVDGHGQIDPNAVADAAGEHGPRGGVLLVSLQWANNETGLIQPVAAIARRLREAATSLHARGCSVYFHADATQAVGKLAVDVREAGVDLLTMAAHKFHGPKGVGALYLRPGLRPMPVQRGGPQERELRGGTENVPGIIGMGVAADLARAFLADADAVRRQRELRDRFETAVRDVLPQTIVNAPDDSVHKRLWNTTNLGFAGLEAEAILLALSERGVCASAGAACSSGSLEPSPVLLAMGVPEPVAHGSVRFSLSRETTDAEVEQAAATVIDVVQRLARTMPVGAAGSTDAAR